MSLLRQPDNLNFASQLNFKFFLSRLPTVEFFIQAVNLPSVNLGVINQPNPFINIPKAGDHITYGPFSIVFKVDELFLNYKELYDWFTGLGFPDSFEQAKAVYGTNPFQQLLKETSGKGAYSDGTLTILNSSMNSIATVTFSDMFPVGLSEITFDTRNPSITYIEATCTFAFRKFSINSSGSLTTF